MARRFFGRENGKFLIQEEDGSISRHDKNPLVGDAPAEEAAPDATTTPATDAPSDYEKMSAQQLRALAKERSLIVPQGAKKAGLVALLVADDAGEMVTATGTAPDADDQEDGEGE